MKKLLAVTIMILFISMSVIPSTGTISSITGRKTIYVDDDNTAGPWNGTLEYPYQYIQDGIDNAISGDTVFVFNGTYYGKEHMIEVRVKVNKTISLIGENRTNTIIDGGSGEDNLVVVRITADWVNISGFTIQTIEPFGDGLVIESNHTNASNNNIHTWFGDNLIVRGSYNSIIGNELFRGAGMVIESNHTLIKNNIISDSDYYGIRISSGSMNITISGNTITYNYWGIYSYSLIGNCTISGNTISSNWLGGITFSKVSGIIISNNSITNNPRGLSMDSHSNDNIISNNAFSNNQLGIRLIGGCQNNIISGNIFSGDDGIGFAVGCRNNIISGNTIMNNEYDPGIYLGFLSISNSIIHNNFINNSRNAEFGTLSLYNKWDGNYWGEPRTLPYPIIGCLGLFIPSWVNFDWHPAQEPYDIGV